MAARDREVRAHEQAHLAAAGALARGGISLTTERGPDGRYYAVAGEVSIDTAPVAGDPQATIAKAQRIRRAAHAPAEPSAQDRRVAAQASAMEMRARAELAAQRVEEAETEGGVRTGPERETTATREAGGPEAGSCPVCGGPGHGAAEHVAGNQRRVDSGLAAVEPRSPAGLRVTA